ALPTSSRDSRIHISQLTVLEASEISHFEISCRTHGGVPTLYLFCRFYLATALPTRWITIEKRRKRKNTSVPTCHTEPFDSLKGWRDKFSRVNSSVAPIAMWWFDGISHEILSDEAVGQGAERHATSGSGRAPILVSSTVSPSRSVAATKANKFVPAITSDPAKRLESSMKGIGGRSSVSKKLAAKKGILVIKPPASTASESDVGSSYDIVDDLASSEAGSGHLVSFKEFIKSATSLSSASTRS
ncbi:hypothetical protein Tco_0462513, partial [Tanacetum coccineum]